MLELVINRAAAPVSHFTLHRFESLEDAPFDTHAYSRMKFGSNRAAHYFGNAMADHFFHEHADLMADHQCVVVPAPSTFVPVAATLLAQHFMNRLNHHALDHGMRKMEWTHVHRISSYTADYPYLSVEERERLIKADSLFINSRYVEGKCLLFIDDVKITGTHERKISRYLQEEYMENPHAFVTFAEYGGADAAIESRLNRVEIKSAFDVIDLANCESDFQMTARGIRIIMETPTEEMAALISKMSHHFVTEAYNAAIHRGYSSLYPENFKLLRERYARS